MLCAGIQEYHYKNFEKFFGIPLAELADGSGMVVSSSLTDLLGEYFSTAQHPNAELEGRLTVV